MTISDTRTEESDKSGNYLADSLITEGHRLAAKVIEQDNLYKIRATVSQWIADPEIRVILTTGGTGFTDRDVTPEAVVAVCDRVVPGLMEGIRIKFGADNPAARLSRSVAGIAGTSQVYALPGSVRAVQEYLGEILKTLEHALYMLHGLDLHETGAPR